MMKTRKSKSQDDEMLKELRLIRAKMMEENQALQALIKSLSEEKKSLKK